MNREEFSYLRKELNKTQRELAELLGTSLKAIHSYEQGWRSVPPHVERQLLFLFSRVRNRKKPIRDCWTIKHCPASMKRKCPAWEFRSGKWCWFITGTICGGEVQARWSEKIRMCRGCDVFFSHLSDLLEGRPEENDEEPPCSSHHSP